MIILQLDGEQFNTAIETAVRNALSDTGREAGNRPTTIPTKEILSIDEASAFLNLAKPTVYGLTSRRELPFFKTGKKLYFKQTELLRWIEEGKRKTVKESTAEVFEQLKKGGLK